MKCLLAFFLLYTSACAHQVPVADPCPVCPMPDPETFCREYNNNYKIKIVTLLDQCKQELTVAQSVAIKAQATANKLNEDRKRR